MLTRKAPLVLALATGLVVAGVAFHRYAATALGVALLLLFATSALATVPPALEGAVRTNTERASEGQRLTAHLSLTNRGRRSAVLEYRLDLDETLSAETDGGAGRTTLGPGDQQDRQVHLRPHLFGLPAIGPLRVRITDPCGFRYAEYEVGRQRSVLVYPLVEPLKSAPLELGKDVAFFGVNEASQPGDGFEFYTLRKWQHGDSIRSVNWRASARAGEMIVNQRQRESYLSAALVLDATEQSDHGYALQSPFTLCGRGIATLADFLIHQRDRVQFYLLTDHLEAIHPQTPERQRLDILEALSTCRPHGRARWDQVIADLLPKLSPGQPVVLASSFETDPTIIPAIRDLAAREHQLIAISAPTTFPPQTVPAEELRARRLHRDLVRDEVRAAGGLFIELDKEKLFSTAMTEAVMA